jgi:hypothetical protein
MVKIDLEGLKDSYYAGETINVTILLSGIRGLEARGVYLELYYKRLVIIHGKTTHRYVNHVKIFSKRLEEARKFEIDSVRYNVEIPIPEDAPPSIDYDPDRRVDWILKIKIDIPYHRDVTKEVLLKVYNSVEPDTSVVENIVVKDPYIRLEIDKNMFGSDEGLTGRFIIREIPSNLRSIAICLDIYLEIRIDEGLFSRSFKSEYKVRCERFMADDLEIGREYEFRLKRTGDWPMTYVGENVKVITFILLKMDRRLMIDRKIKTPITIYLRKGKTREKIREKIEEEELGILSEKILSLMEDGKIRDIVDIRFELNFEYDTDEIIKACDSLVEKGLLEVAEPGTLLKKYVIKRNR